MCVTAAGGQLPADRVIDGLDPSAALAGEAASPHEILFFQYRNYGSVRAGRYKLLRTSPQKPWMLFDLATDLGETTDISVGHSETVEKLAEGFRRWQATVSR
jgi:hypothetical protein